ncbi:recombinase RecT [Anaerotignum sp.]|uniref:recombinase RecT n=1 Tax=Anaerotignum sp. TaxID=2039241 RepID=UPI0027149AE5|nr:recombinase RecT [Anaerotignum sp.]
MSNQVAQRPKFSVAIQTDTYKNLINNTLQDPKRAQRFIASISSAVAINPDLQTCDAGTILSSALLGESLELSPSPQLGQYYMVPFKDKKNNRTVATFILGYKGYIQLAQRSGYYKHINVVALKKGELINYDPLNEIIEVNMIQDDMKREAAETIGYYAMFEYLNGFKKIMYWSKEKMANHANKYSPAFSLNAYTINTKNGPVKKVSFEDFERGNYDKSTEWLYSSFWYKDFDGMAYKTMLRQLISKWGIMSIDLRQAFEADETMIDKDGTPQYVDEPDITDLTPEPEPQPEEPEEVSMDDL